MAFDYFQENDEEKDQQSQGQPKALGSESPLVTGNQPQQSAGADGEKQSASGSFTNLNSYLDANQSLGFGNQVAGKVQQGVTDAENEQQKADQGFRSSVDENVVHKDQSALDSARTNPNEIAGDPTKLANFEKMRDARYQGPNTLSDRPELFSPAQQSTDRAYSTANQTKDEGGRKAFLQQEYGAGQGRYNYTTGQQKLDNLLIQNDPNSRQAFEQTWNNAQQAKNKFGALSTALNDYAGKGKGETAQTRADTRASVGIDDAGNLVEGNPIDQVYGDVQQQVDALGRARNSQHEQVRQDLGNQALTDWELSKTGLSDGQQTWGVDPTGYWQQGAAPEAATVASAEQQQRINALSKLAAMDNRWLPDAQRAGTYDANSANKFDLSRYLTDVNTAKSGIEPRVAQRNEATRVGDVAQGLRDSLNDEDRYSIISTNEPAYKDFLRQLNDATGAGIDVDNHRGDPRALVESIVATKRAEAAAAAAGIPSNYQAALRRRSG